MNKSLSLNLKLSDAQIIGIAPNHDEYSTMGRVYQPLSVRYVRYILPIALPHHVRINIRGVNG